MISIGLEVNHKIADIYIEPKMVEAVWCVKVRPDKNGSAFEKRTVIMLMSGRTYATCSPIEHVLGQLNEGQDNETT